MYSNLIDNLIDLIELANKVYDFNFDNSKNS